MKRLTRVNLLALAGQVPVLDEKEQRQILGGTDDSNGIPTPTATTTGVVIPEPYAPPTEETTPGTTSTTTGAITTGSIDESVLTGDLYSAIMDIFNSTSGDIHINVTDSTNNTVVTDTINNISSNDIADSSQNYDGLGKELMRNAIIIAGSTYKLDTSFERKLFNHYWDGSGSDMVLPSNLLLSEVLHYVHKMNIDHTKESIVVNINGKKYYKKTINFYNDQKFDFSLGSATVYFTESGGVAGFRDTYDFNKLPNGVRPDKAEGITEKVGELGEKYGAKSYNIYCRVHEKL